MPLPPYYGQQSVQPQQFMQQMPMNQQLVQQPIQNYQSNAPVMSIAPVSGKENAVQFPVGVGTESGRSCGSLTKLQRRSTSRTTAQILVKCKNSISSVWRLRKIKMS